MKPPPFHYVRAISLDHAVATLAGAGDEAKVLAGGQSLIAMMNLRLARPHMLVDINRLREQDYIRQHNGHVAIGALTRQSTVEESALIADVCPLLTEAIRYVAHKPIRNRGTIGGNLAHADPTSELPAVAVALDASFTLQSQRGTRTLKANEFFVGYFATALAADELLTEVSFPTHAPGQGWSFMEYSPRKGDYALVGVAATLEVTDGKCAAARLVYVGVGERAQRIEEAEQLLLGNAPTADAFQAAADVASRLVDPASDVHASATYRRELVNTLTRRALAQALDRSKGA